MSASAGLFAGVREGKAGKAAVCRDHQGIAERRGVEAVSQRQPFAAGLPFARRHRLVSHEEIV
jgi:hypothetical protein